MSQPKPKTFKYVMCFICIFITLTAFVQLVAYETGVYLRQGIIFSNFLAAGCAASILFVYDYGRAPDGWENRLLSLACIVVFSFFELGIGFVLLETDSGKVLLEEMRNADAVRLSLLLCGVVFSLYLSLLFIFGWGAKLYAKVFVSAG